MTMLIASTSPLGGDAPPRHSTDRRRPRFRRAVLAALAAAGLAAALAAPAPAAAAPVGVPVLPGGQVTGWGANWYGQTAVPAPPAGQTYTAVAAGDGHSLALTADGQITSWGYDGAGLVSGAPTGGGYTAIAAGINHSLALTADGHITAWGSNDYGQVSGTPTGGGHTAIAAGYYHSLTLTADGHITAWGNNDYGQVSAAPTGGYTAIAAGAFHSLALTADGHITAWGNDGYGLVSGTPTGGYTAIAGGGYHSLALAPAPAAPTFIDAGPVTVNGIAGTELAHTFTVTGTPAATVAVTTGVLPAGLTLSPGGVLSGTPTAAGSFPFTVTATNSVGTATLDVTLTVAAALAAPVFTDARPVALNAVTGTALTREFTVTGNPAPVITVIDPATLPPGMTFTDGVLSGTPTTAGEYTFILNASNGVNPDLALAVTVTVTDAPRTPGSGLFGSLEQLLGFGS